MFLAASAMTVLLTSVVSSAAARKRESALLRVIGASSRTLTLTIVVEYFLLGTMAALTGTILSIPIGNLFATKLFEVPFSAPYSEISLVALYIIGSVTTISWVSLSGISRHESLAVLRDER